MYLIYVTNVFNSVTNVFNSITLKNGIHSFPAWHSANRDSVENKPASLLVVPLGKTLNEMPLSLCGRQVVGPSSLPIVVAPV